MQKKEKQKIKIEKEIDLYHFFNDLLIDYDIDGGFTLRELEVIEHARDFYKDYFKLLDGEEFEDSNHLISKVKEIYINL